MKIPHPIRAARATVRSISFHVTWYAQQDRPLPILWADLGHAWRYYRTEALGKTVDGSMHLATFMNAVHGMIWDGWVISGRNWEDRLGHGPEHPDRLFRLDKGPHLHIERVLAEQAEQQ